MSNIDKRALREAAEKATPGNWWIDSHGMAMVAHHNDNTMIVFVTDGEQMGKAIRHEDTGNLSHWRNDNDASFIAAANPATVLALLDELEAKDKQIDDLKATAAHSNAGWKEAHEQEARAEAAEKRIAELEAREVLLPPKAPDNLASCLDGYEKWLIATTFRDTWNACLAEVVRVNAAAGKGEAS